MFLRTWNRFSNLQLDYIPKGVYHRFWKLNELDCLFENISRKNKSSKDNGGLKMEYDKNVINRLKRIEGQIKGVLGMIDQGKDCREVVTQLSAARTAIDRTMGVIVSTNLEQCVRESVEKGEDTDNLVKEAVELLTKSR